MSTFLPTNEPERLFLWKCKFTFPQYPEIQLYTAIVASQFPITNKPPGAPFANIGLSMDK